MSVTAPYSHHSAMQPYSPKARLPFFLPQTTLHNPFRSAPPERLRSTRFRYVFLAHFLPHYRNPRCALHLYSRINETAHKERQGEIGRESKADEVWLTCATDACFAIYPRPGVSLSLDVGRRGLGDVSACPRTEREGVDGEWNVFSTRCKNGWRSWWDYVYTRAATLPSSQSRMGGGGMSVTTWPIGVLDVVFSLWNLHLILIIRGVWEGRMWHRCAPYVLPHCR